MLLPPNTAMDMTVIEVSDGQCPGYISTPDPKENIFDSKTPDTNQPSEVSDTQEKTDSMVYSPMPTSPRKQQPSATDSPQVPAAPAKSQFFSDGVRKVDFILVYHKSPLHDDHETRRQFFQYNITKSGLEVEEETPDEHSREEYVFVKIHASWNVLCREAEQLKLKMPLKLQDALTDEYENISIYKMWKTAFIDDNPDLTHKRTQATNVTWNFSRKKMDRFNIGDKETFFTDIQRIELVWEILQSARNDPKDEKKRGIESLLEKHVYSAAYPPHDGDVGGLHDATHPYTCRRQMLEATWASWKSAFMKQPLDSIRQYFGEKISFYFAYLGFYTKWLTLPAFGGLCSFIYGLAYSGDDAIVEEFCNKNAEPGNYTMCPLCEPPNCEPFMLAEEGCMMATWDYRMDNEATFVLACLSVIWATAFLKMWKRREAELAFQWDTYDMDTQDVVIRPEYEEKAPKTRENMVTREMEPYVPRSTRIFWLCVSVWVTLLMLGGVSATLSGLVLLRIQLYGILQKAGGTIAHHNVEISRWIVHGLIFIVVMIFEKIYGNVALKLTSWECPKTQSQYMSSFLWKVFVFELLNDFIPIAYAAWFKGRFIETPLDLSFSSELCDPGGCLAEVVELIAVLLLARLVVGNAAEVGIPFLQNVFAQCLEEKRPKSGSDHDSHTKKFVPQYRKDLQLNELELDGVAEEYMEMIVQFAFVTLFVPAFPLAPLVCFLNNIAEIRVDAINFVVAHRRPLPIRVPGIQIWNKFMDVIIKLAIVVNACLISFTSDLIPRMYFKYGESDESSLKGYGAFALSKIELHNFAHRIEEYIHEHPNVTECHYQDFREEQYPFIRTGIWWKIMLLRVTVFAMFTITFFTYHWLFNFLISDVPNHVAMNIRRRKFVVARAIEAEVVYDKWLNKTAQKRTQGFSNPLRKRSAVVNPEQSLVDETEDTAPRKPSDDIPMKPTMEC